MTNEAPGAGRDLPLGDVTADEQPPPYAWSVWSAAAFVSLTVALSLLAGALAVAIGEAGWDPAVHALAVGAVLGGVYVVTLGVVRAASAGSGVPFAKAVGVAGPPGRGWYAIAASAAICGWLFALVFMIALRALGFEAPRDDLALFGLMPEGFLGVAIMATVVIVVAPIAEEIVYRGVLLGALERRWGRTAGLVVSALVFSAVHGSVAGFVPLAVVGGLMGWLYRASGSLRVAIVAHALFNAMGVAVLVAQGSSGIL